MNAQETNDQHQPDSQTSGDSGLDCHQNAQTSSRDGGQDHLLHFASDYQGGAHPAIMARLLETNGEQTAGYGFDGHSERARDLIRTACDCPDADVFFLVGGTQANAVVIDAMIESWQGIIAPTTGHISAHEAGAIEHGGHKVIELPSTTGKISAAQVDACAKTWETDANRDHMVMPGMVYLSQPTERGTLYARAELEALSNACHRNGMKLYVDGARLAYALACPENDVALPDLARLCDAFYIGGTKCGALLGEAVVIPEKDAIPHFFTQIKQHGALLAKGRVIGIQFEVLFEDGLYERIGIPTIEGACRIRESLAAAGVELCFDSPTNQVFAVVDDVRLEELSEKVEYGFWEKRDDDHTVIRLATCWSTTPAEVDALIESLAR